MKNNPTDQDGKMQMQKFLFDHGLERQGMENILRGQNPSRPFIPLEGQPYKGVIKGLKSDEESGQAVTAIIEADVGELLFLDAPRENIFVHGHWMGKADLRYLFENGKNFILEDNAIILLTLIFFFHRGSLVRNSFCICQGR